MVGGAVGCYVGYPSDKIRCESSLSKESHSNNKRLLSVSPFILQRTKRKIEPGIADYDFVVVGYGTAGRSAVKQLKRDCPSATVALVDPLQHFSGSADHTDGLDFYPNYAMGIDPRIRQIHLLSSIPNLPPKTIHYKHGVLLATGARGAPIPHYLYDDKAANFIWELRPTIIQCDGQTRQVLRKDQVYDKAISAAQEGKQIAVLGSGWDAVDIAIATVCSCTKRQSRPILVTGSSGPLRNVLPDYLASSLTKRLRVKGLQIMDRTLIQYIRSDTSSQNDPLHLYTCKSYDSLDISVNKIDRIVAAPDTNGSRGCATVITLDCPEHLKNSQKGRSWYTSWSSLAMTSPSDPISIGCYKDDGRVAVNAELCAVAAVYAAGSVAKFSNSRSGHADVAGYGIEDATKAGQLAASNMSRVYRSLNRQSALFRVNNQEVREWPKTLDPIAVFRTDRLQSSCKKSWLSKHGVNALLVGNCDSERFATHAIWWTNQAAQKRLLSLASGSENFKRRKTIQNAFTPVYGLGVIYFQDQSGRVQGVMTWGLPFTSNNSEAALNHRLVELMKDTILYNGYMNSLHSDADNIRMATFLEQRTKELVSLAFEEYAEDYKRGKMHQRVGEHANFPKSLHRYSKPKLASVRTHGMLKRKEGQGAHGILGEDLFTRYEDAFEDAPLEPPDMAKNIGFAAKHVHTMYEWQTYERLESRFDENEIRARPSKEDLLWIRKGDENRNQSHAEKLYQTYKNLLTNARASDRSNR
jgi:hypothetical protein